MAGSGEEVQLSYEEKENLDEMIMHAKKSCFSEDIVNQSRAVVAENKGQNIDEVAGHLIVLGGALQSFTKGPLTVVDSKLWAGYIVKDYPNPLSNLVDVLVQVGVSDDGLKAAVVYAGKNSACVDCGWLLAWADSQAKGKRVYAECGPKSNFDCIDWARIENKLDGCCPTASYRADDKETGTWVSATLVGAEASLYETRDVLAGYFCG